MQDPGQGREPSLYCQPSASGTGSPTTTSTSRSCSVCT